MFRGLRQLRHRRLVGTSNSLLELVPLLWSLLSDAPRHKARPLHALSLHFRSLLPPRKMAEDPESALTLPPSTAADGEGPTDSSPGTATPEPPSSAAVSPGTEEPAGDAKKKSKRAFFFWVGAGGLDCLSLGMAANKEAKFCGGPVPDVVFDQSGERKCTFCLSRPLR